MKPHSLLAAALFLFSAGMVQAVATNWIHDSADHVEVVFTILPDDVSAGPKYLEASASSGVWLARLGMNWEYNSLNDPPPYWSTRSGTRLLSPDMPFRLDYAQDIYMEAGSRSESYLIANYGLSHPREYAVVSWDIRGDMTGTVTMSWAAASVPEGGSTGLLSLFAIGTLGLMRVASVPNRKRAAGSVLTANGPAL